MDPASKLNADEALDRKLPNPDLKEFITTTEFNSSQEITTARLPDRYLETANNVNPEITESLGQYINQFLAILSADNANSDATKKFLEVFPGQVPQLRTILERLNNDPQIETVLVATSILTRLLSGQHKIGSKYDTLAAQVNALSFTEPADTRCRIYNDNYIKIALQMFKRFLPQEQIGFLHGYCQDIYDAKRDSVATIDHDYPILVINSDNQSKYIPLESYWVRNQIPAGIEAFRKPRAYDMSLTIARVVLEKEQKPDLESAEYADIDEVKRVMFSSSRYPKLFNQAMNFEPDTQNILSTVVFWDTILRDLSFRYTDAKYLEYASVRLQVQKIKEKFFANMTEIVVNIIKSGKIDIQELLPIHYLFELMVRVPGYDWLDVPKQMENMKSLLNAILNNDVEFIIADQHKILVSKRLFEESWGDADPIYTYRKKDDFQEAGLAEFFECKAMLIAKAITIYGELHPGFVGKLERSGDQKEDNLKQKVLDYLGKLGYKISGS